MCITCIMTRTPKDSVNVKASMSNPLFVHPLAERPHLLIKFQSGDFACKEGTGLGMFRLSTGSSFVLGTCQRLLRLHQTFDLLCRASLQVRILNPAAETRYQSSKARRLPVQRGKRLLRLRPSISPHQQEGDGQDQDHSPSLCASPTK